MLLFHLTFIFICFLFGISGVLFSRRNVILLLIFIELIFLSITLCFLFYSSMIDDLLGYIIGIVLLSISAVESVIGLSFIVAYCKLLK